MNTENFPEYYKDYVALVPEADPQELFDYSLKELLSALMMITEDEASKPYAPGKWSIKDILQHLIDTERIFAYRALSFARGEEKELPGYDHDAYANRAMANYRSLKSLLEELKRLRLSTKDLFTSFSDEMKMKAGTANGQVISVEQLQYIIVGHELHHLKVINEKYDYKYKR
ncbi:MAG: DinB family protein [Vicingaceae bacterium]